MWRVWVRKGVYRVLVRKPEGKRPLGRLRSRWVDNIRTDLQEVGCGYMDWIGLAQDRDRWRTLVSAVMNLRVPWNAGNFLTSCKPVSCSRMTLHHGVSKLGNWRYMLMSCTNILGLNTTVSRSQWPRGLRRGSAAASLLGLWVRIPPGAWMSMSAVCCQVCDGLITRPEESYRLWCVAVCDLDTSWIRRSKPPLGRSAAEKKGCDVTPYSVRISTVWLSTPTIFCDICLNKCSNNLQ